MDWHGWLSLGITLGALLVLITTRLGAHLVMMAALSLLGITGILTSGEALAGFSNSGVMTVAAMFVVAAGIHSSGGIDLLVNKLLGHPKTERSALARVFAPVVLLSAFLNNTPVVATMIPALLAWSRKIGIAPSKLMIPLSYCAILGGTMTLIGTSTNLVVNGQYQALTGEAGFSLFSISIVGVPVAIAGLTFMWLFFPKWLPDRSDKNAFGNMREFTLEVAIDPSGPLVGKTVAQAGLRNLERVYLVEIERAGAIVPAAPSEEKLRANDRLVFAGDTQAISDLLRINGIIPSVEAGVYDAISGNRAERCLVEAVVSPHCAAVGYAIRDAQFHDRYGAIVLAVARNGERVQGNLSNIRLKAGDTLLLESRPAFVHRQKYNKDFLLINDLATSQPRHEKALLAWGILALVVLVAGFDVMNMLYASLLGAGLMLASGCCSISQAEKSLDFQVLITIAASFALGVALEKTGVAAFLAQKVIAFSGGNPLLMLILVYVTVSILTEIITNNAAAVLMLPIALDLAARAGLNNEPFIFGIMMAASASFATPLGYQCNLMVYGPGNYRFTDFLKVGVPMNIFMGAVSLTIISWVWPLVG
ncbi:MAG: SLC13 family permease [Marinagarivorans sp.]|nr:SLC13 family permease [Marinagarivorans sp.]